MSGRAAKNAVEHDLTGYPDVIVHLAVLIRDSLIVNGIGAEEADASAVDVAGRFIEHWGGSSVYIPKAVMALVSKRNQEIFARCNGRNVGELAREYRLSRQRIYQIIETVRRERRAANAKAPAGAD